MASVMQRITLAAILHLNGDEGYLQPFVVQSNTDPKQIQQQKNHE